MYQSQVRRLRKISQTGRKKSGTIHYNKSQRKKEFKERR